MTEDQWWAAKNPREMLPILRGKATDRKLRLFACACARHVWQYLPTDVHRNAVEVGERFADGQASGSELSSAFNAGSHLDDDTGLETVAWAASGYVAVSRAYSAAEVIFTSVGELAVYDAPFPIGPRGGEVRRTALAQHAQSLVPILHDIFGPFPFRSLTADPTWHTSTVVSLADAIYTDRAFDRLPILADALEEASCDNADILAHCRSDGPHVRGCWVVDLLLGKQ